MGEVAEGIEDLADHRRIEDEAHDLIPAEQFRT